MHQPNCIDPVWRSCSFYATCAEAALDCGPDGYPLGYGLKNCLRFERNISAFSVTGQSFIWDVMHCLQSALVNVIQRGSTCDQVSVAAFASHAPCYLQNGFCALPVMDWVEIAMTVKSDLIGWQQTFQIIHILRSCGTRIMDELEAEISSLLSVAEQDALGRVTYLAKATSLSKLMQDEQMLVMGIPIGAL